MIRLGQRHSCKAVADASLVARGPEVLVRLGETALARNYGDAGMIVYWKWSSGDRG